MDFVLFILLAAGLLWFTIKGILVGLGKKPILTVFALLAGLVFPYIFAVFFVIGLLT